MYKRNYPKALKWANVGENTKCYDINILELSWFQWSLSGSETVFQRPEFRNDSRQRNFESSDHRIALKW